MPKNRGEGRKLGKKICTPKNKGKKTTLTFKPLPILLHAPMPKGHLTLHPREVGLGLVEGKVPLGEQSLHPSNLALVPLGGGVPLLDSRARSLTLFSKGVTFSRASRASLARSEHFRRSSADISHSLVSSPSAASRAAFSFSQAARASHSLRRKADFSRDAALSAYKIEYCTRNQFKETNKRHFIGKSDLT